MKIAYLYIAVALILVAYWAHRKVHVVEPPETVLITVFVQNKKEAARHDCSITQKKTYEMKKPSDTVDASLKILFDDELKEYGQYDSVSVENGIAQVHLKNELPGLSSCQIGHITSVLDDTLTQYPTISSVELYGPNGKIEF